MKNIPALTRKQSWDHPVLREGLGDSLIVEFVLQKRSDALECVWVLDKKEVATFE